MNELLKLKLEVENCRRCPLWRTRNKPVFGEGPSNANIMLIGMGPGYHENQQGRPFVGAAGKLLEKLLASVNLKREQVYITNVIKCYLPDNNPTREEIKACSIYLDKQIDLIKPKVIIALGNTAVEYTFNKFNLRIEPMSKLHGRVFTVANLKYQLKLIPMYHPAAALRNPGLLEVVKEDWRSISKHLCIPTTHTF